MDTKPVPKKCASCMVNDAVKLTRTASGQLKIWRCLGCIKRKQQSWITLNNKLTSSDLPDKFRK